MAILSSVTVRPWTGRWRSFIGRKNGLGDTLPLPLIAWQSCDLLPLRRISLPSPTTIFIPLSSQVGPLSLSLSLSLSPSRLPLGFSSLSDDARSLVQSSLPRSGEVPPSSPQILALSSPFPSPPSRSLPLYLSPSRSDLPSLPGLLALSLCISLPVSPLLST
ncbi:hypothetical protein ACLOJK_000948 [Asimina triloba]